MELTRCLSASMFYRATERLLFEIVKDVIIREEDDIFYTHFIPSIEADFVYSRPSSTSTPVFALRRKLDSNNTTNNLVKFNYLFCNKTIEKT